MITISDPLVRKAIYHAFKGKCFYSGRQLPENDFHIDHVVPRSAGGEDSFDNYVLCAPDINLHKSAAVLGDGASELVKARYAPRAEAEHAKLASGKPPRKKRAPRKDAAMATLDKYGPGRHFHGDRELLQLIRDNRDGVTWTPAAIENPLLARWPDDPKEVDAVLVSIPFVTGEDCWPIGDDFHNPDGFMVRAVDNIFSALAWGDIHMRSGVSHLDMTVFIPPTSASLDRSYHAQDYDEWREYCEAYHTLRCRWHNKLMRVLHSI